MLGADMFRHRHALKEIIATCKNQSSSIFMCFLDASKAFARVKYRKLFIKLMHSKHCRSNGGTVSAPFKVSNGVRQGGISSFQLVLGQTVNKACNTGCVAGDLLLNHLMIS